jgi:hypothetical protein
MLCGVANVLVIMFVLILLVEPDMAHKQPIGSQSIDYAKQMTRAFYLGVISQIPNNLIPHLITYSKNMRSVTLLTSQSAHRINQVKPTEADTKVTAEYGQWVISTRIQEFKAYVTVATRTLSWLQRATFAILLLVCMEAVLIILVSCEKTCRSHHCS